MWFTTPVGSKPPKWIKPQLTRLVEEAPAGDGWLHEIKYDGYRMHARLDGGDSQAADPHRPRLVEPLPATIEALQAPR